MVGDEVLELLVGLGVLGLELDALDGERVAELADLADRVVELVEADVEVPLLLLELVPLLVEQLDVLLDAVRGEARPSVRAGDRASGRPGTYKSR